MQKKPVEDHTCVRHDQKFPNDPMRCNPNSSICSDCPFPRKLLAQRIEDYKKKQYQHLVGQKK